MVDLKEINQQNVSVILLIILRFFFGGGLLERHCPLGWKQEREKE
jgi:hypothetical protein